jgi:hypothetical protein
MLTQAKVPHLKKLLLVPWTRLVVTLLLELMVNRPILVL